MPTCMQQTSEAMYKREIYRYRTRAPEQAPLLDLAETLFTEQLSLRNELSGASSMAALLSTAERLAGLYPGGPELVAALRDELAAVAGSVADPVAWARSLVCSPHAFRKLAAPISDDLRPFLAAVLVPFHRPSPDLLQPLMPTRICPVCGGPPLMARFRQEDGVRVLACLFCRTEWTYPRLRCAACGNRQPGKLRFFYAGGDPGHRVDLCEQCRTYVKASDERVMGRPVILYVEDIVTAHLDHQASRMGYHAILDLAGEMVH